MNLLQSLSVEIINGLQIPTSIFSSCRFKGSSTDEVQTTSLGQQELSGDVADQLADRISTPTQLYGGQLTADIPNLVDTAFDQFTSQDRSLSGAERASLGSLATGESFFDADPEKVIQDWRENFANPLTSYYNEFVRPEVREEFNVPGGFNTSERAQGVSRSFNEFYGSQVAPTLFQAQENDRQREFAAASQARNLQLPALQYSQQLPSLELNQAFQGAAGFQSFQQPELTARYNDYLRALLQDTQNLQLASGFATTPTVDTVVDQGAGLGGIGAAVGAGVGALAAGSVTGGLGAGQGALIGASIGGGVGQSF